MIYIPAWLSGLYPSLALWPVPRCITRWGYKGELKEARSKDHIRTPYTDLLVAIDDIVDAILASKDEAREMGSFVAAVRQYFRENNLDLEPRRVRVWGLSRDQSGSIQPSSAPSSPAPSSPPSPPPPAQGC